MVNAYSTIVMILTAGRATQKPIPCLNSAGKIRNMGSDGNANQNVLSA